MTPVDLTQRLWNVDQDAAIHTLHGHTDAVNAVVVKPNDWQAVSIAQDGIVNVWDVAQGRLIASFQGDSPLRVCAITPDGATIVVGEQSGRVHCLRLEGMEPASSHEREPRTGQDAQG